MKDNREPWDEIAALIALEKKKALDDFHRSEFVPGAMPERRAEAVPGSRLAMRPAVMALAASLLLAAGLASFWLLKGSWGTSAPAPELAELLSATYLYSRAGNPETAAPAADTTVAVNPYFARWASAALHRPTAETGAAGPSAAVERGDPEEVRRNIGRLVRSGAFERFLSHIREIQDKEA